MKKQVIGAGLFAALWMSLGAEVQAFNQMNAAETAILVNSSMPSETFQNKREVAPEFPGGFNALVEFISKNLKYPKVCQESKVQGRVLVKFTVKSDGSISNIRVTKPVDIYLDKEAVRVVKSMPRWTPGTQDGKPVNVEYTLPITFKL